MALRVLPGLALVYSLIIGAICFALSVVQRRNAAKTGSPPLKVDARNWFIDGILTAAVAIAFLGALALSLTDWAAWVAYVDPALVIVLGMVMVPTPLSIVLGNVGELLQVAPELTIQQSAATSRLHWPAAIPVWSSTWSLPPRTAGCSGWSAKKRKEVARPSKYSSDTARPAYVRLSSLTFDRGV
jgi:hypothetical protein